MISLIQNEMLKIVKRKKIVIVSLIIAILVSLFTYAQYKEQKRLQEQFGSDDWKTTLQHQIIDIQNRLASSRISEEWRSQLQLRVQQQQYYLDKDINPLEPGAPAFMRMFGEHSINLLIPLMIMIIGADLVSSERSTGTIKLLLTRPVQRWKVLLSKYLALLITVSFVIVIFGFVSYIISGIVFGYGGWNAPVIIGFSAESGGLDTTEAKMIPQWQYLFMEYSLVWFVAIVIGTLIFMLSTLIKNTPTGMGIMLAALIAGMILSNMVTSWESAKYLFMINLNLTSYLSGNAPPIEGMTLGFSLIVLLIWGIIGLIVAFITFTRQDIY